MKLNLVCLALPLIGGCLSARVPTVAHWMIDYKTEAKAEAAVRFGPVRVSQVTVRAPYGVEGLSVLCADGSVAFDSYNVYAAAPAQLLRGCVYDALTSSGLFASVVNSSSPAATAFSAEVLVTRLALDCQTEKAAKRVARVELVLRLIDDKGALVKTAPSSGAADAADGNYGRAFSQAVSQALDRAIDSLR